MGILNMSYKHTIRWNNKFTAALNQKKKLFDQKNGMPSFYILKLETKLASGAIHVDLYS
jgi:hypothetical protein